MRSIAWTLAGACDAWAYCVEFYGLGWNAARAFATTGLRILRRQL